MPNSPLDGRPFSIMTQINDLRATDFVPVVRPSEPLPDDQNVIISGARLAEMFGAEMPGTPPPAPSYPLYGGPGTHTDGPIHQAGVTALLAQLGTPPLAYLFDGSSPPVRYSNVASALNAVDAAILRFNYAETTLNANATAGGGLIDGGGLLLTVASPRVLTFQGTLLRNLRLSGNGTVLAPARWSNDNQNLDFTGTLRFRSGDALVLDGPNLSGATLQVVSGTATVTLLGTTPDLPLPLPTGLTVIDKRAGTGGTGGGGNYAKLTHAVTTAANFTLTLPVGATEVDFIDSIQPRPGSTRTDTDRVEKIDWSFNVSTRLLSIASGPSGAELQPGDTLEVRYFTGSSTGGGSGSNTPIIQLS